MSDYDYCVNPRHYKYATNAHAREFEQMQQRIKELRKNIEWLLAVIENKTSLSDISDEEEKEIERIRAITERKQRLK